jgi:GNAT superfamily N-acetyltransferase
VNEAAAPALPGDLTERELESDDAVAVAALVAACDQTYLESAPEGWNPPSEEQEREDWRQRLDEPERWSRGAFDAAGELVGMIAVRDALEDDLPIAGVGQVSALFVHPRRWREGIAGRLLADGERLMRDRGFDRARLRTPEWAPARRFYEAQGWQATGVREFADKWDMWTIRYEKTLRPA